MYLLIDMSQNDAIHLALFDESSRIDKTFEGRNRELLFCIDSFVKEQPLRPSGTSPYKREESRDIKGIVVVVGAGSFTSTRIACVVANTFAYVKQIPLLAISVEQVGKVQELILELLKQKKGNYISATYSGEPNIGKKKLETGN